MIASNLPSRSIPQPIKRSTRKKIAVVVEKMESRQLLSATVALRTQSTGASSIDLSNTNPVTLDVIVVVSGADAVAAEDAVSFVSGSFISTMTNSATSVKGNLVAHNFGVFTATASSPGTPTDLNGDGNLDVGGTGTTQSAGYFLARASGLQFADPNGPGVAVNGTLEMKIGTVVFTPTNLSAG